VGTFYKVTVQHTQKIKFQNNRCKASKISHI